MEHESDGDTNCNWCTRYNHQKIDTGTGGFRNKKTSGDHSHYIIEIGQNTEKSSGDLRRVAVTQTPVRNYQLTLVWKNRRGVEITIIIIMTWGLENKRTRLEDLEKRGRVETSQATALSRSTKILRRVLSFKLQWETIGSRWCEKLSMDNNNNNNNNNNSNNNNNNNKLLWDFNIHKDHLISARRPDLIIINKKENMQNCRLCCPGWPQNKTERMWKEV